MKKKFSKYHYFVPCQMLIRCQRNDYEEDANGVQLVKSSGRTNCYFKSVTVKEVHHVEGDKMSLVLLLPDCESIEIVTVPRL